MLIKELRWNGLPIWPPLWAEKSHKVIEYALIKSVNILPITELIKIDAIYSGTIISGVILSSKDYQETLYQKLKQSIGKPLKEVGNIEINS